MSLSAPFPWFGGKSRAAGQIWQAFGKVRHYVEPFAGSLATLLRAPYLPGIETVNDADAYLANFWRAAQSYPDEVAQWADYPVSEADLHARHQWLVDQVGFRERMLLDLEFFDPKIAGWWVWGLSQWIGGEWCSERFQSASVPVWRNRPHCAAEGMGVHKVSMVRPWRRAPHVAGGGKGVHRQVPAIAGDARGRGIHRTADVALRDWMQQLAARLRGVRILCGDWTRVLRPAIVGGSGITGILLDPPYSSESDRSSRPIYGIDCFEMAHQVAEWARDHGGDPDLRIVLCGLEGEHEMPGWSMVAWTKGPGYGSQNPASRGATNSRREVLWLSPHCVGQTSLFDHLEAVAAAGRR